MGKQERSQYLVTQALQIRPRLKFDLVVLRQCSDKDSLRREIYSKHGPTIHGIVCTYKDEHVGKIACAGPPPFIADLLLLTYSGIALIRMLATQAIISALANLTQEHMREVNSRNSDALGQPSF